MVSRAKQGPKDMSRENMKTLNTMQLFGFTLKRGRSAWWRMDELAGGKPNHFDGPVPLTAAETLLDFDVIGLPCGVRLPDGSWLELKSQRKAMVCSDELAKGVADDLGVFKSGYNEKDHQYKLWLLKMYERIIGANPELGLGSVGLLANRGRAYAQFELPENIKTKEGVSFRPNLLFATSFDGSLSSIAKRTQTIVECDNTLELGLGELGQGYKIKHTKYSGFRMDSCREALAIVVEDADNTKAEIERLCGIKVSALQWKQFLDAYVPVPTTEQVAASKSTRGTTMAVTKREKLTELYLTDQRAAPWVNTAFGVLQAVNTYQQHEGLQRGNVHRATRNMENVVSGKFAQNDNEALELLFKIAA
jgi:phage/plasmid-like protein (TIGR03299 family)